MQATFVPIHSDATTPCTQSWPCNVCFASLSTERQAEIMETASEIRNEAFSEGTEADRCARCANFTIVHQPSLDSSEKVCEKCDVPIKRLDGLHLRIVEAGTEKFAFVAVSLPEDSVGLYGLGVAVRDEPGYTPMADYFCNSNSREKMEAYAAELNAAMGMDAAAVDALVLSTMRAQNAKVRRQIGPVHA